MAPDEEFGLRHLGGGMLRRPMSAFEVRADMGTTLADVCNDPEQTFSALFDHLVGGHKQGLWHNEAEYLRGLEIDHQFELGWLLDRQVRRAGSV